MKTTTIAIVCLLCAAASAQEWIARYSTGANRREAAEAVAVNDSGDIFVAGYARGLTLIKYSPAGETMWVRTRPRPDLASDTNGIDVAWWPHGTVLVAAGVRRDSLNGFRLVNFTNSGTCQYDTVFWHSTSSQSTLQRHFSLSVTPGDRAYIVGTWPQDSTGGLDVVICKFLADPRLVWTRYINRLSGWSDNARAVAVDSRQNIHIAGMTSRLGQYLAFATKFDSSGQRLWYTTVGSDSLDGDGKAVAGSGTATYLIGMRQLTPTGPKLGFVSKLTTSGGTAWSVSDSAVFDHVALDTTGSLYVTADEGPSMYDRSIVTLKYTDAGQLQWRRSWSAGVGAAALPVRALLNAQREAVIAGQINQSELKAFAGLRYTSNGTLGWCDTSPDLGDFECYARDAVLDPRGDLIVTGSSVTQSSYATFVTMKFHPVGAVAEPGVGPVAVRPGIGVLPAVARAACRISAPGWDGPLVVADRAGRVVRTLAPGSWDLRDGGGRRVADGVYFILAPPRSGLAPARIVVAR